MTETVSQCIVLLILQQNGAMVYRLNHLDPMTTTATTTRACEACAFWNKLEDEAGECRRHAPQTISFEVDDEVKFESMFPVTGSDDWCGDFEQLG